MGASTSSPQMKPRPRLVFHLPRAPFRIALAFFWSMETVFGLLGESEFPQPDHCVLATKMRWKVDSYFVLTGRSVPPMLGHQAGVADKPFYFHGQGMSGHVPFSPFLFLQLPSQPKLIDGLQRIQHSWCRHPVYNKRMENLCRVAMLDELHVYQRSILIRSMTTDAAIDARDCIFLGHPSGKRSNLLRLSSIV